MNDPSVPRYDIDYSSCRTVGERDMAIKRVPAVSFIVTNDLYRYEQLYKPHMKVHIMSFDSLEVLPELTKSLPVGQFVPLVRSNGRFHVCLEGPERPKSRSTHCEFRPWSGLVCPRDNKTTVYIVKDPNVKQDAVELRD